LPPLREASNSVSGGSGLTSQSGWHVTPPSIFLKLPFIAQSTLLPATEGWRQHFNCSKLQQAKGYAIAIEQHFGNNDCGIPCT